VPNFSSISSGVSEPQVAKIGYLPLTGDIALTTVYALTCYIVILFGVTRDISILSGGISMKVVTNM